MDNILLTGATRGLGLAIAQRLKKEGYHVIATGRKLTPELDALVNESELQGKVSFYAFDLSATEEIHDFVQSIVKDHGPIFGLVNNAALGHDGVLATMHDSQISELVNVNVLSPILLTKYASRSMLMKRRGRIVNISSIIATTGFNGLSIWFDKVSYDRVYKIPFERVREKRDYCKCCRSRIYGNRYDSGVARQ